MLIVKEIKTKKSIGLIRFSDNKLDLTYPIPLIIDAVISAKEILKAINKHKTISRDCKLVRVAKSILRTSIITKDNIMKLPIRNLEIKCHKYSRSLGTPDTSNELVFLVRYGGKPNLKKIARNPASAIRKEYKPNKF